MIEYSPYERLFFGQVRDIRILRYAASLEEITSVLQKGDTWFKWRQAVRVMCVSVYARAWIPSLDSAFIMYELLSAELRVQINVHALKTGPQPSWPGEKSRISQGPDSPNRS